MGICPKHILNMLSIPFKQLMYFLNKCHLCLLTEITPSLPVPDISQILLPNAPLPSRDTIPFRSTYQYLKLAVLSEFELQNLSCLTQDKKGLVPAPFSQEREIKCRRLAY